MSVNIQKKFGSCLRDKRLSTGLSQEKFALKINMDRSYYASVESGNRNVSLVNIERIVAGLEISLSDFFSAVDNYKE